MFDINNEEMVNFLCTQITHSVQPILNLSRSNAEEIALALVNPTQCFNGSLCCNNKMQSSKTCLHVEAIMPFLPTALK